MKPQVVVAISSNTGSFGHRGVITIDESGEAMEYHVNAQTIERLELQVNSVVWPAGPCTLETVSGLFTFECPRRMSKPPKGCVEQVRAELKVWKTMGHDISLV